MTRESTTQLRATAQRRLELIGAGRALIATGASPAALIGELHTHGASRDEAEAVVSRVLGWSAQEAAVAVDGHPAWQTPVVPQLGHVPWSPTVADSQMGIDMLGLRRFNAILFVVFLASGLGGMQLPALFLVAGLAMLVLPFSSAVLIAREVRAMRRGRDGEGHIGGLLLGIGILAVTGALWLGVVWFVQAYSE